MNKPTDGTVDSKLKKVDSVDSNSDEMQHDAMQIVAMDTDDHNDNHTSGSNNPFRSIDMDNVEPASKKDNDNNVPSETGGTVSIASGGADKKERHLKWDENAIEEHDKLRGTRMKIDEPNTPYAQYDSGAESDGSAPRPKSPAQQKVTLSWDLLQTKLDSVAAVRSAYPSSPNSSHGADGSEHNSDAEDERKKEMKKLEFQEHRKRHYNEMELVRKFRMEQQQLDDDEEDEDGDADVEDD